MGVPARAGDMGTGLLTMGGAVLVHGQEPLTATMLAAAKPDDQKQMLGERLFPLIYTKHPGLRALCSPLTIITLTLQHYNLSPLFINHSILI